MSNPALIVATKNNAAIAATNTSTTVTSTGSVTAGNLQIVAIEIAGAVAPSGITPPAGWTTLLGTTVTETSGLVSAAIFYKLATATGAFSGSFSWTTTSTGGEWLFMEWSGAGAALIDGAATTTLNGSSTSPTSPAITPSAGNTNDTLVGVLFGGVLSTSTVTIPGGMTSILTVNGSATQTLFGAASLSLASASTAAAKTWTLGTAMAVLGVSFLVQQTPWAPPDKWPDLAPRDIAGSMKSQRGRLSVPFFQVWYPPIPWPDSVRRAAPLNYNPLTFVQTVQSTAVTWNAWTQWPDTAPRARPATNFIPWTFLEPAPQVWFPPNVYPDIVPIRAKPVVDFIPWSFIAPTLPTVFEDYVTFDDFARRGKPSAVDFTPWSFIPPPAQVWYPPDRWPDMAPAAKRVAQQQDWSYGTFATPVTTAPTWTQWTQWPDFATKPKPAASFTPWTFIEPAPQVWYPPSVWPDFARGAKPLNYNPLAFVQTVQAAAVTWNNWSPWPDIVPIRARPVADFRPWSFVEPPPQVWFPPILWPDFLLRKPSPVDTQPSAFVSLVVVQTTPTLITQWPDFAKAKIVPLNYNPFAFVQTITTPFNGFTQWPDFARRKASPLLFDPLTLVQAVKTPWNTLSTWPDFAPIRGKAGLHAALQQFAARFPGVITQATITVIMSAFETNSDSAVFAISVLQSQPAVTAGVSIQEIGGLSATSIHEAGNT